MTLTAQWAINRYKVVLKTTSKKQGTVKGGKTAYYDDDIILKAMPKQGYKVDGWYDGKKKISGKTTYEYRVTKKVTLTAVFKKV
jgi:hypothetical protein